MCRTHFLKHLGVRRVARLGLFHLCRRQPEPVKEDFAELLGRADVELRPRERIDVLLDLRDARVRRRKRARERRTVHRDARPLHRREDGDEWEFHRAVQLRQLCIGERRRHRRIEPCRKDRLIEGNLLVMQRRAVCKVRIRRRERAILRRLRRINRLHIGKRRTIKRPLPLLGAQQVVREREVKNLCAERHPRLHITLRIPKHDGTRRQNGQRLRKMRGRRVQHAAQIAAGKRQRRKFQERRRPLEHTRNGDPLRRAQRRRIERHVKVKRCEVNLRLFLRRKERLLHMRLLRGGREELRETTPHGAQLVRPAKRLERPAVGLHTKALRRIAEFGDIAFDGRKLLREECLIAVL